MTFRHSSCCSILKFKSEAKLMDIISGTHHKSNRKQVKKPLKSLMEPLLLAPQLFSKEGEYMCSVCSDSFTSLVQLARHVQFHDRDRPFPCAICGKRFLSRSHHDEHQRVHTGERPFPCEHCKRSFTTHHNLKRHQMIHDKEDAYRCTVCGVLFCQKHQLGNLNSIICVLNQQEHNQTGHTNNVKLMTNPGNKQEENVNKKKRQKLHYSHVEDEQSHDDDDDQDYDDGWMLSHADTLQLPDTGDRLVPETLHKPSPRIRKIAYDMEIIL